MLKKPQRQPERLKKAAKATPTTTAPLVLQNDAHGAAVLAILERIAQSLETIPAAKKRKRA